MRTGHCDGLKASRFCCHDRVCSQWALIPPLARVLALDLPDNARSGPLQILKSTAFLLLDLRRAVRTRDLDTVVRHQPMGPPFARGDTSAALSCATRVMSNRVTVCARPNPASLQRIAPSNRLRAPQILRTGSPCKQLPPSVLRCFFDARRLPVLFEFTSAWEASCVPLGAGPSIRYPAASFTRRLGAWRILLTPALCWICAFPSCRQIAAERPRPSLSSFAPRSRKCTMHSGHSDHV